MVENELRDPTRSGDERVAAEATSESVAEQSVAGIDGEVP